PARAPRHIGFEIALEPDRDRGVEQPVRFDQDRADDPIHLVLVETGGRARAHEEHVPLRIEREMHPVRAHVSAKKQLVERVEILLRPAHEERLEEDAVPRQGNSERDRMLALPVQLRGPPAVGDTFERDLGLLKESLYRLGGAGHCSRQTPYDARDRVKLSRSMLMTR